MLWLDFTWLSDPACLFIKLIYLLGKKILSRVSDRRRVLD
jgi:hypothetical protein